jgi:hypothetical protein
MPALLQLVCLALDRGALVISGEFSMLGGWHDACRDQFLTRPQPEDAAIFEL